MIDNLKVVQRIMALDAGVVALVGTRIYGPDGAAEGYEPETSGPAMIVYEGEDEEAFDEDEPLETVGFVVTCYARNGEEARAMRGELYDCFQFMTQQEVSDEDGAPMGCVRWAKLAGGGKTFREPETGWARRDVRLMVCAETQ